MTVLDRVPLTVDQLPLRGTSAGNLLEFLNSECTLAQQEHDRHLALLQMLQDDFQRKQLQLSPREAAEAEAHIRQEQRRTDEAEEVLAKAMAEFLAEQTRMHRLDTLAAQAQERESLDRELRTNAQAITDAGETVRLSRERLVNLNYRSIWLMQRLGELREVDPAGGKQMSKWFGEQPRKVVSNDNVQ
jgi:hypothetical protein